MCIFCEKAKNALADGALGLTPSQKRAVEECDRLMESRIKATILTGFLGAGKTTFLNFVLKSLKHGQRVAVVQNEFGNVSIDDQLMPVEKSTTEVVVMPNGCLCCRVRGDLVDALRRLSVGATGNPATENAPPLDGIIIECSGLSEVAPVAQTFFADAFVQASYRLDGVVCMCDAANFDRLEASNGNEDVERLLKEQLGLSDVVLLNKCDLVDSARRDALSGKIRSINPSAKVVPCRQGKVNLQQVLKIGSFSLDTALSLDPHFLGQDQDFEQGRGGINLRKAWNGGSETSSNHAHKTFGSLGLEIDDPINLDAFKTWMKSVVEAHGEALVRVKGVLLVPYSDGKHKRVIVQGVGGHIEIGDEVELASDSANKSRLVFIGRLSVDLGLSLRTGFHNTAISSNSTCTDPTDAMETETSAKM